MCMRLCVLRNGGAASFSERLTAVPLNDLLADNIDAAFTYLVVDAASFPSYAASAPGKWWLWFARRARLPGFRRHGAILRVVQRWLERKKEPERKKEGDRERDRERERMAIIGQQGGSLKSDAR